MTELNEKAQQLLKKPLIAHLATVMPDGTPQVTPTWVDTDGQNVLVNTAEGRIKTRNVRRMPKVALSVVDPADPFMGSLQVRGEVVEVTTKGADEHIDALAGRYTGADRYQNRLPGEVRVIIKIRPLRVSGGVTWAGRG